MELVLQAYYASMHVLRRKSKTQEAEQLKQKVDFELQLLQATLMLFIIKFIFILNNKFIFRNINNFKPLH